MAARTLGAKAFALGDDVAFAARRYAPGTAQGRELLAHEIAHVAQQRAGTPARIARQPDDPDHPPVVPASSIDPEVALEPLAEWTPIVNPMDPASLFIPPETTREQIAQRLYGDPQHFGGFDIVADRQIRLRSFDGVREDVVRSMQTSLDLRLDASVTGVVSVLCERRIDGDDEWYLLNTTEYWASRGDLKNASGKSYFDAYLDQLDTHPLEEWGLFSNTARPASEWLVAEAEEKQWAIYPLIGRRSSRPGAVRHHRTGEMDGYARVIGPITWAPRPYHGIAKEVGGYSAFSGEDRFLRSSRQHRVDSITVDQMVIDEPTSTRAEIALLNFPTDRARVMIPGSDGHFYGYTIAYPTFFNAGQALPDSDTGLRLEKYWWHYPGTVFVPGGGFQPEFGKGGDQEQTQRRELLDRALVGGPLFLRALDFDVLGLLTFDQRVTAIGIALKGRTPADASLITRIFYATPSPEFALLEHRLSTNGMMTDLINLPSGLMPIIGRIFTVKALEAMEVPGENLENLPEFKVGWDSDGFYQYAYPRPVAASSRLVSPDRFPAGGRVGIGQERTATGESPAAINRTVVNMQPAIFRHGGSGVSGAAKNFVRGTIQTLVDDDGPAKGPFLPTQLVKVTSLGPNPETRIVTVVEAVGLLEMPTGEFLEKLVSTHMSGALWLMAGMGIVRAFGPALAEGLASGTGARAIAAGVVKAAGTQAGRAAIIHTALIGAMDLVDRNRSELQKSAEGRAFLEIYDVTMMVWISHDVGRLITSGLVPRLVAAADRLASLPSAIRDGVMPIRAEAEAVRRAIARYASPVEAAAAATTEGLAMSAGAEARPGFFAMLRVARGEVATERLLGKLVGTTSEAAGKRVLERLGGVVKRSEEEAAAAVGRTTEAKETREAASRRAQSAADAQFAIANRAAQLRPDARDAFLAAVEAVVQIPRRSNSLASLTDLLVSAAQSRTPNAFILEVHALASRPGVSNDALLELGRKVRKGSAVLDLAWLNRTSITDEALDFLGRDKRTQWDLFRRAAADPGAGDVMRQFRTSARGAGAEMVAQAQAERLGTNVRRQVAMGESEIDFEITVAGRRRALEIKGWTVETWQDAIDAALKRMNKKGLTVAEKDAVKKIDSMLKQLQDGAAATGRMPMLGVTDAMPQGTRSQLRRILKDGGVGATEFVELSEAKIKETAAGTIGAAVGVPRP